MFANNTYVDPPPGVVGKTQKNWFGKNFYLIHGSCLYTMWGALALVMLATNRYCKGRCWKKYMWIHGLLGAAITVFTLFFAIQAWWRQGWVVHNNVHSWFVFPVACCTSILSTAGIISR